MTATTPEAMTGAELRVRIPPRSLSSDLRAIKVVWHREMLRFVKDRPRLLASLIQPILYLFVLGTGLGAMARGGGGPATGDFRVFLFPGVSAMAVLFTCFFQAGSLVWDREFGFMREMMVAPVRRSAILLGKCLGGTTAGLVQGVVMLIVGAFAGVHYTAELVVTLLGELTVLAFAMTAFGVAIASRLKNIQSFMAIVQMALMPLFFLSGALFPLGKGLPTWLMVLTRLDPLTYAVDPMRRAVFESAGAPYHGVSWGDFMVPTALELAIVLAFAFAAIGLALPGFTKAEA